MKKAGNWIPKKWRKKLMKVNKDLDVQDFFTPNQSLNSLNTYHESFPEKDNLHKNWMQVPTGFFRRTIWLCWHVGHSRTLSPAGLCSPPPCDLKEIKPTKQHNSFSKEKVVQFDNKLQKTWRFHYNWRKVAKADLILCCWLWYLYCRKLELKN
jgi:hypothetical protein